MQDLTEEQPRAVRTWVLEEFLRLVLLDDLATIHVTPGPRPASFEN